MNPLPILPVKPESPAGAPAKAAEGENAPVPHPLLAGASSTEGDILSSALGEGSLFGDTQWSLVRGAGAAEYTVAAQALDRLCHTYWPAVYALTRRYGHAPEDARDLTQAFFARLIERRWVQRADPGKGRFRTFLVTTLKRFLADETDRARALKRGGGCVIVSMDLVAEEEWYGLEPHDDRSPDWLFDRRWALTVMRAALDRLKEEQDRAGAGELFAALMDFLDGDAPEVTLASIGARFGLRPSAIKMRLLRLRERYREVLRAEVAETLTDRAHLDDELRDLFAALG